MNTIRLLITALLFALLGACASTPVYLPPTTNLNSDFYRTINVGYDDAWSGMIDYVSTSFFSIKDFEKDSGLLTLNFGKSNIPKYVDCGTWDGQPYIERDLGFYLTGRMNIRIKQVNALETSIRVSTIYDLRDNSGNIYAFRENTPATVNVNNHTAGTPSARTCQSTQEAERIIITGIDAFSSK